LNNYTSVELDSLKNSGSARVQLKIKYLIFGEEVGESGTPHLQGYINFNNPKRLQEVHLVGGLERAHFEVAKGTAKQNYDYTTKDGKFYEYGEIPMQGKRTDIDDAVDTLKRSKNMLDVANNHPVAFVKYAGGFQKLLQVLDVEKRNFKTKVWWFHGPTGTGKSKLAYELGELSGSCYTKMPRNKWWDGYSHENVVVVDDYRKDLCTFHEMLQLTDRYPFTVEMKGSSVQFRSKVLIITSPQDPKTTWEGRTEEDLAQLLRRIDVTLKFPLTGIAEMRVEGMRDYCLSLVGAAPPERRGLDLSEDEIIDEAAVLNAAILSQTADEATSDFEFDTRFLDDLANVGYFDVN
jgi:hypothetical protein